MASSPWILTLTDPYDVTRHPVSVCQSVTPASTMSEKKRKYLSGHEKRQKKRLEEEKKQEDKGT